MLIELPMAVLKSRAEQGHAKKFIKLHQAPSRRGLFGDYGYRPVVPTVP